MTFKQLLTYLIILLAILMIITWNDPNWQIQIPALYFFTMIGALTLIDMGAFEGYFRSKSPGYLSNIDDQNSHASLNHKDMIDFIDPLFSTEKYPTARFTAVVLNGLDYGIVSVRGRGPIEIFPTPYLRKKSDGFANDGEFELWKYDELTPSMKEALDKFSKVKNAVKNNKVDIWVSTVSNLDGSNVKSNLDHNQAVKQSQKERNAVEKDYDRALEFVRGKKVLTRKGRKDSQTYENKED